MTNKEILQLSVTLSGCTFKSLGSDLFIPMIEFIGAISSASELYEKKQKDVVKHLGLTINATGNIAVTDGLMADKLNDAFTELANEVVDITVVGLDVNAFQCLSDENPTIKASDLLLIKKYLVNFKHY